MIDLTTQYAGLTLRNPIIIGSSGLTSSPERNKEYEKAGAGAIVLKSLFEEQIEMQSSDLMKISDYPEATDYIREYVKTNQINNYLEVIKKTKATCSIPIIASINCYKADAWINFARQIEQAGADALELNVFYMDTDLAHDYDSTRAMYVNIIRKVKETISIPVIMKIGKFFSNIPALVHILKINGADGIVLFNRFYRPDIDINTVQLVSGNVFSSHADLGDTLRWTAIVSGKIPGFSISSSTGVHDWEDVIKCLLAGASTVQMCSAVYTHGSEIISQVLTCVEEWMTQAKYNSISQFRGKLNYANINNPGMYERSQFMKYFSNRD
ncbi:dihydroorotate dehydrogenase (fumarate) [Parabacteroides sp. PF5-5]|uniref:dihydroorotate dehydrogenase-like protein n=1 Tax=unclassified Parabacteroides TaxID=2649774 RepID=UPI002473F1F9|nr:MULTISPECIES: dihydroorotate dehydrogenase-like protein [unclassified Parabacteroides]MDH6305832.1 dihydroorotate dehydrogenase (fumarate) [Parabacteroides sp. PH5-39]MDH6317354.1 dihydroorotate dehydrogenase (fumarate) [Parabacteroides sp. PF5-13]MDH6320562.1 dihydroorotate dehydrogenase (fumarate) [Parabacteroides sp. PH5-13]MDH6324275.1 dihydroorotate dehydrogenase (fumarate) [Parabacteroides sp. PH5-8]MDH6328472.1 dihydroorotate dehydrogenase (fumarate) [Parabacteroides sp. PH5-41]